MAGPERRVLHAANPCLFFACPALSRRVAPCLLWPDMHVFDQQGHCTALSPAKGLVKGRVLPGGYPQGLQAGCSPFT